GGTSPCRSPGAGYGGAREVPAGAPTPAGGPKAGVGAVARPTGSTVPVPPRGAAAAGLIATAGATPPAACGFVAAAVSGSTDGSDDGGRPPGSAAGRPIPKIA